MCNLHVSYMHTTDMPKKDLILNIVGRVIKINGVPYMQYYAKNAEVDHLIVFSCFIKN